MKKQWSILLGSGLSLVLLVGWLFAVTASVPAAVFDGERALADIEAQLSFGPRTPESPGRVQFLQWAQAEFSASGWTTAPQAAEIDGHEITNLVAQHEARADGQPWFILAAHYDTRIYADQDPDPEKRGLPVPGANDGASGVAVLLELARVIPADYPAEIWLVLFDAEDNGRIEGWDWILGSRAFVAALEGQPDAVIIVDMIGDADLNIKMERNSDVALTFSIWEQAAALGYSAYFLPMMGYSMLDDHTPFLQAGIPAVDVIDFDYPYWHTTEDTLDKVSAESLQIVGDTLLAWLQNRVAPLDK
ncbi:MAG: M28 family peptidase [Chloroflexi bacterium]|nr:M28 family peptidase [Chloroflexota bacterium]